MIAFFQVMAKHRAHVAMAVWLFIQGLAVAIPIGIGTTTVVAAQTGEESSGASALSPEGLAQMLVELEPEGRVVTVASMMQAVGRSDSERISDLFGADNSVWPNNISGEGPELDVAIWQSFFETAVIVPGNIESRRPVVGFYSPLLDIWLLTQWDKTARVPQITAVDVTFSQILESGQTGLSEIDPHPRWVSSWQSLGLVESIQSQSRAAVAKFESRFLKNPGQDQALSPSRVRQRVAFRLLHVRTALMASSLAEAAIEPERAQLVDTLLARIADGKSDILAGLPVGKDALLLAQETIALPELTRVSLLPAAALISDQGFAVIATSVATPRIFVVIEAKNGGGTQELQLLAPFDAIDE
ncbi:MAG: hypothetical protein ACMVY4_02430 [Minwuia sp.]|uniref:hypothetical protein n=1 Tax=Minwuia sp. TaxID=2493630 RepID=UPI003A8A0385